MDWLNIATSLAVVEWLVRLGISLRVVMRRLPIDTTFAWLIVVLALPIVGGITYAIVGEARLGSRRARQIRVLEGPVGDHLRRLSRQGQPAMHRLSTSCELVWKQASAITGQSGTRGNQLTLLSDTGVALARIAADIRAARTSVHLEFYILNTGGAANDVVEALIDAARRGVACRVLLDDAGSRRFLRGPQARRMRDAGVRIVRSLPVSLPRALVARLDLRNHRKIVAVDGAVGYVGSMNLGDAGSFASVRSGLGPWVDAMVRMEGPVVERLELAFIQDWILDAREDPRPLLDDARDAERRCWDNAEVVQIVPSGPGRSPRAIHDLLLTTLYNAERRIVLTTPYFVPDDATMHAIRAASDRGVAVSIILPARVNSPLVRMASHALFDELLESGVDLRRYNAGLLHAKTIRVDEDLTIIGSVNLDQRSFYLNFEISLLVYGVPFARQVDAMQDGYFADSIPVDPQAWRSRPRFRRVAESVVRLLSPVL